jgi:TorA maturation chaperone TorD
MNKEMLSVQVSPRIIKYKTFAAALSYPDDNFFAFFPEMLSQKEELTAEYDRLFRAGEIWLYETEYTAENEFQKVNSLADIMGFYHAFGVEPNKERPDSITAEFEFMYYLIYKQTHALKKTDNNSEENKYICFDAQKNFFLEHIYTSSKNIADSIISKSNNNFYITTGREILKFIESEKENFASQ